MSLVKCPAPGCDYSGSKQAVKGHWGGKQDEDHAGKWHEAHEAYQEAREQTADDEQEDPSDGPEEAQAEPQARAGASTGDAGNGSNPAFDGPSPDTSNSGSSDNVDLPCGHESYDPSETPDPPFKVTCEECGTSWRVTP